MLPHCKRFPASLPRISRLPVHPFPHRLFTSAPPHHHNNPTPTIHPPTINPLTVHPTFRLVPALGPVDGPLVSPDPPVPPFRERPEEVAAEAAEDVVEVDDMEEDVDDKREEEDDAWRTYLSTLVCVVGMEGSCGNDSIDERATTGSNSED